LVKTVKGGDLGVAVTPDGTEVYVTSFESGSVAVIATATNTFLGSIEVGLGPFAVGIIPAPVPPPPGLYAYVANSGTHTVSVINTATNKVAADGRGGD
jgi:YVTN family beta-propeller protein